jgi:hypothetical protein
MEWGGAAAMEWGERGRGHSDGEEARCAVKELTVAMRNEDDIALFYSLGNSLCGPVVGPSSVFDVGRTPIRIIIIQKNEDPNNPELLLKHLIWRYKYEMRIMS